MLAAIIDWKALGEVAAASFVVTVAVTTLFTTGLLLAGPHEGRAPAAARVLGATLVVASMAIVVAGLYVVMTSK